MNVLCFVLLMFVCMFVLLVMLDDLFFLGDVFFLIVLLEQEFQLGCVWLSMLCNQVDVIFDLQFKDFVESSVYWLVEISDLQDYWLVFIFICDVQINVFVVFGGVIGVNGGLLFNVQIEGEYVVVLVYEFGYLIQCYFVCGIEVQQCM